MKHILTAILCFGLSQLLAQPASVYSFTPRKAAAGSTVTLTGVNFNPVSSRNLVHFGFVKANVLGATPTTLSVVVPPAAPYANITVFDMDTRLSASSPYPFSQTFTSCQPFDATWFAPQQVLPTYLNSGSYGMTYADINQDGKPDMIVVNKDINRISIYQNTSVPGTLNATSFATPVTFSVLNFPSKVATGDFDGDGKQDIVVCNVIDQKISVLRNTHTGGNISSTSFAEKVDFNTGYAANSAPYSLAIGDVDADGRQDIVVANNSNYTVSVMLNTITPGSDEPFSFSKTDIIAGTTPHTIALADLDGDRKPEMIVTNTHGHSVSVYSNFSTPGNLNFNSKIDFSVSSFVYGLAVGDLNNDGKPELVIANYDEYSVSVFQNNIPAPGTAVSASSFLAPFSLPVGNGPNDICIDDINGDGYPDIFCVDMFSGDFAAIIHNQTNNLGASSFANSVLFQTNSGGFPAIADLDGDGKKDMAIPGFDRGVALFKGSYLTDCVLPVKLNAFRADLQSASVALSWNASAETNTSHYEIEKSTDGKNFTGIGTLKASQAVIYSFNDPELPKPTSYYRLKISDKDGIFKFSNILSVSQSNAKFTVKVSPNPFHEQASIQLNGLGKNVSVLLFDQSGKKVLTRLLGDITGSTSFVVSANELKNGIYYYTVTSANGHLAQGKVVVQ